LLKGALSEGFLSLFKALREQHELKNAPMIGAFLRSTLGTAIFGIASICLLFFSTTWLGVWFATIFIALFWMDRISLFVNHFGNPLTLDGLERDYINKYELHQSYFGKNSDIRNIFTINPEEFLLTIQKRGKLAVVNRIVWFLLMLIMSVFPSIYLFQPNESNGCS
jgi:hypothetical protein